MQRVRKLALVEVAEHVHLRRLQGIARTTNQGLQKQPQQTAIETTYTGEHEKSGGDIQDSLRPFRNRRDTKSHPGTHDTQRMENQVAINRRVGTVGLYGAPDLA